MRTTATVDDDVLTAARQYADAHRMTLGQALSELVRKALLSDDAVRPTRAGIVLLPVSANARASGLDDVQILQHELP